MTCGFTGWLVVSGSRMWPGSGTEPFSQDHTYGQTALGLAPQLELGPVGGADRTGDGQANVMVIAVLERRGEIGLRRALGARRLHVAVQFAAEATVLAGCGGLAGAVLGGFATTIYAAARHWNAVVPVPVLLGAAGVAVVTGAVAGLYPAWRAVRLVPAEALRLS